MKAFHICVLLTTDLWARRQ